MKFTLKSPLSCVALFGLLTALLSASFSVFAAVQAPPLPPGSANVNVVVGQSPIEQERMQRAHKHHSPAHYKKDMTRDDTQGSESTSRRYGSAPDAGGGNANSNTNSNAK